MTTTLADLNHYIGGDLSASNTGDLSSATGLLRSQQRILRRLLTNPGDYIFHPDYGAGLPRWIGRTADLAEIRALIRGQIQHEESVSKSPEPVIQVSQLPNADGGGFSVVIRYVEAGTSQPVVLSFNVSA